MATKEIRSYSHDDDNKMAEHVSDASLEKAATTRIKRRPPELVRDLSSEERQLLEKALVRKIDFRLLPTIILMYIMNYLDRNNIAAARLAGLQDLRRKEDWASRAHSI